MPERDHEQIQRLNSIWNVRKGNQYRINNVRTLPHDWRESAAKLPKEALLIVDDLVKKNDSTIVIFHITHTDHYHEEIPLDSFKANIGLGVLSRVE